MRRNPGILLAASLFAVIVLLASRSAQAQPDYKKAAEHYNDAEKAMESSQFELAAREYGIAYEITKDPVLFYKIASANDKAGDCAAALIYYRRYLKEANPDESFKKLTEDRITHCADATAGTGSIDTGGTGDTGTGDTGTGDTGTGVTGTGDTGDTGTGDTGTGDTGTGDTGTGDTGTGDTGIGDDGGGGEFGSGGPSFIDEKPSWKKSAAWIAVGATVALATAGAVLGLSASSREQDVQNLIDFRNAEGLPASYEGNTRDRYEQLADEGESFNTYSKVAFVAAGVAAACAVTFFVLDLTGGKSTSTEGATIAPIVTDDSAALSAAWTF
jgi:tetratricopeptide (TPR) repeat protein